MDTYLYKTLYHVLKVSTLEWFHCVPIALSKYTGVRFWLFL